MLYFAYMLYLNALMAKTLNIYLIYTLFCCGPWPRYVLYRCPPHILLWPLTEVCALQMPSTHSVVAPGRGMCSTDALHTFCCGPWPRYVLYRCPPHILLWPLAEVCALQMPSTHSVVAPGRGMCSTDALHTFCCGPWPRYVLYRCPPHILLWPLAKVYVLYRCPPHILLWPLAEVCALQMPSTHSVVAPGRGMCSTDALHIFCCGPWPRYVLYRCPPHILLWPLAKVCALQMPSTHSVVAPGRGMCSTDALHTFCCGPWPRYVLYRCPPHILLWPLAEVCALQMPSTHSVVAPGRGMRSTDALKIKPKGAILMIIHSSFLKIHAQLSDLVLITDRQKTKATLLCTLVAEVIALMVIIIIP